MCNNFKITDFAAIQMAVDACAAAGGGTVLIPEGEWHTGPIRLKSHVHIQFETGAKLVFSGAFEEYLPAVLDLCQYFEHKKLKGYADFFNSSSSFCCGVI